MLVDKRPWGGTCPTAGRPVGFERKQAGTWSKHGDPLLDTGTAEAPAQSS